MQQEEIKGFSSLIKVFVNNEKEHLNVNKDCGLKNKSKEWIRFRLITYGNWLFRMHEWESLDI